MYNIGSPQTFGILGTAVTIALVETLVSKGVLTAADARGIFERAATEIGGFKTEPCAQVVALINSRILPRFAE